MVSWRVRLQPPPRQKDMRVDLIDDDAFGAHSCTGNQLTSIGKLVTTEEAPTRRVQGWTSLIFND
jgi:hypothetical protein